MGATHNNTLVIVFVTLSSAAGLIFISGMPPGLDATQFGVGVATLVGMTLLTLFAGWWLLMRPLPEGVKPFTATPVSRLQRWVIGLLLIVGLTFYAFGIVWDEIWHIQSGIPFGEDFWWRPHQLLYIGLLIILGLSIYCWWILLKRGTGTWAQRFRGSPMLGVIVLNGVLFAYAIPADPVWHEIYGEDLTALSVPHVLVILLAVVGLLAGFGVLFPVLRKRAAWAPIWKLQLPTSLMLVALVSLSLMLTALLTSDWFGLSAADIADGTYIIFSRPAFPLAIFLAFIPIWLGTIAVRSLRLIGAATTVGVLVIVIRFSLNTALSYEENLIPYAWMIQLGCLIAVDGLHFWRRDETTWWQIMLVGGLVGSVTTLPLINAFFLFPEIGANNVVSMVVATFVGAGYGAWLGCVIGDYFASRRGDSAVVPSENRAIIVTMLATLVFLIFFVVTATPPV